MKIENYLSIEHMINLRSKGLLYNTEMFRLLEKGPEASEFYFEKYCH